jgi:hypothetical protein
MDETKHEPSTASPAAEQNIKAGTDFDRSDPQALLIAGSGIASIIALIAIILGVQAYFDHITAVATYDKVLVPISDDLKNLRSQEAEELNSYKYIDRNKGTMQIPISRAMELLAKEAAENKLTYFRKPTAVKVPEAPGANGANTGAPAGAAPPASGAPAAGAAPTTGGTPGAGGTGNGGTAAPAQAGKSASAGTSVGISSARGSSKTS